jgi:hypothetical protein
MFVPLLCIVQFGEFCGGRLILLLVFTMSAFSLFFQYNSKEGSVKLLHDAEPRPRAISGFASNTITTVAYGNNHCGMCKGHVSLFPSVFVKIVEYLFNKKVVVCISVLVYFL